jgi:hypothetical protein
MGEKSKTAESYKPSGLHSIYRWIDRLPGPYWLFSVAFVLVTGILNHIVAWNANVLASGEINWDFAFTGLPLGLLFFGTDFLFRFAKDSLVEFRPLLAVNDDKFDQILFEFIHLPARATLVIFIAGTIIGTALGFYLLPRASEINFAFPELEISLYTISFGIAFIVIYMVIRTLTLINRLFEKVEKVNIFNQNSIYALSRYSAWLIFIISIPVSSVYIIAPGFAAITGNYLLSSLIVLYLFLFAIFWFLLRGINGKLILEKRRLLIEVNNRIIAIFSLLHAKVDSQKFGNIVELREALESLKIEKEMVEALHTTPWKTGTIAGLVTALFLPLIVSLLTALITKYLNI